MKQINALENKPENAERAYVYCGFSPTNHNMLGSSSPNKTPPYNTGKVLIGSAYTPPPLREYSRHEEQLQSALLDGRTLYESKQDRVFLRVLYVLAVVSAVIVYLTR